MTNSLILLRSFWLAVVLALGAVASAQERADLREMVAFRVDGLTSATRDALTRDLERSEDLRVVFACVPAGIIILAGRNGQAKAQVEERSLAALNTRSGRAQAQRIDQSLAQAEATCEQARNR